MEKIKEVSIVEILNGLLKQYEKFRSEIYHHITIFLILFTKYIILRRFYGSESLNCRSKEDKIRQLNITRGCNCWGRGEFCFFPFSGLMIVFVLRSHFLEQPWKRARKWINKLISEWASERVVACVREWVSKRLIERGSW